MTTDLEQAERGDAPSDLRMLRRFADRRDPADRHRVVERYLPLARYAANRYAYGSEPFDDLVQVACIGLLKAVDRYEPDRRASFPSYALPTMWGELRRHFRDRGWAVRPPRTLQEHALVVERATEALTIELGRAPTVEQLATRTELSVEDVLEAREACAAHTAVSLATPVGGRDGGDESVQLGERLGRLDPGYDRADDRATVDALLRHLSRRDREIVRLRMEEDLTQSEIGARVGLSQMHVSRILRDTLETLRQAAERQRTTLRGPATAP
jgi:RNA polymerase sigma-B factor